MQSTTLILCHRISRSAGLAIMLFFIATTARAQVGIGIINPVEKLEVAGNIVIPAGNTIKYAAPKTKTLIIPANDFFPINSGFIRNLGVSSVSSGASITYTAAVQLPDGAVITNFNVAVVDNDGANNIDAQLWRYLTTPTTIPSGSTFTQLAATPSTTINSPAIQVLTDNSIVTPIVDNTTYNYQVYIPTLYTGMSIYRATIMYTVTEM